jgi:hypothetical protein
MSFRTVVGEVEGGGVSGKRMASADAPDRLRALLGAIERHGQAMMASRLALRSLLSIPQPERECRAMAAAWAASWSRRGASERRSMIARRTRWLAGVILASMQREYPSAGCFQVAPLTARSIEWPGRGASLAGGLHDSSNAGSFSGSAQLRPQTLRRRGSALSLVRSSSDWRSKGPGCAAARGCCTNPRRPPERR